MRPGVFTAKNIFRKVYVALKRAVLGVGGGTNKDPSACMTRSILLGMESIK